MKKISEALLATFFPTACHLCNQLVETKTSGVVCQSCWDSYLPFEPHKKCQKCGYPYLLLEINTIQLKDCTYCRKSLFSLARACGAYQGAMQASILHLKTSPYLPEKLFELIKNTLIQSNILESVDLIIPIPLHQTRLSERSFNQSELIAEKISDWAKITLDNASLARIKPTIKHRVGMDKIDRSNSLKGAFEVTRPRLIANQIILLVDDIFTTGSTISAATSQLIKAKAKEVRVFTLARTV